MESEHSSKAQPQRADNRGNPARAAAGVRARVLIVEDDKYYGRSLARALLRAGFECDVIRNPADLPAFVEAATEDIDIALVDIVLDPEVNGVAFAAKLRDVWPSLKLLYLSAYPAMDIEDFLVAKLDAPLLSKDLGVGALTNEILAELAD